ncbi:MAG: response regulator [Wenzhouxiangellaceae bacterium]
MTVKRVLVVDDAEADRLNLEQIVVENGVSVSSAANGREAIEKARSDRPDLIFLDILMPEMDGFETCRLLQGDEHTRDIPVVIVSSKPNKADRIWALEQGASGYITKPYTASDIQGALAQYH